MQTKMFRAKTIDEAMAKVKNDLGPDAMIVSTNRLRERIGGQQFEIAAVPSGESLSAEDGDGIGELKSELMSIKEMLSILDHSSGMIENLLEDPAVLSLYGALLRNGVNARYARMLVNQDGTPGNDTPSHPESIRTRAIGEIMQRIRVSNPFAPHPEKRIIGALVGTTGVGKTTTIAKLAAQLMLKEKKTVGLISIDNYRIGALEQLKTYANILGVPCFPAFNLEDLRFALRRLEGRDIVLIDTAGQSQYDRERLGELRQMMTDDLEISTHLLLSTTTTEAEMHQTAIRFDTLNFRSYIFTKIDEAKTCGAILNQVMNVNRPISFITNGQNVPEDIELARKQRVVELLFRNK